MSFLVLICTTKLKTIGEIKFAQLNVSNCQFQKNKTKNQRGRINTNPSCRIKSYNNSGSLEEKQLLKRATLLKKNKGRINRSSMKIKFKDVKNQYTYHTE